MYAYVYVCIYISMYVSIVYGMHIVLYTLTRQEYIHTLPLYEPTYTLVKHTRTNTHTHIHTHTHTHTHTHVYVMYMDLRADMKGDLVLFKHKLEHLFAACL